jgi:hypothetical protein
VAAVPHRATAFLSLDQVRSCHEDDAGTVLRPIRAFFATQNIKAKFA